MQQISRAPAVSVAQAPTSKVPVPSTPAQNTTAQKPLVLAPPQPTSTTSDESALPFPSAYAPANRGASPPPQLTLSASDSALTGDPQPGANPLDDRQSDGQVVSLLSPEYAHLLEPDSAFAPTATRWIADHWTPWWRLKRVDLVPKSLSNMGHLWWQNSGRSHSITGDLGIGHERVMFAPSIIAPAIIPAGASLYLQSDRGLNVPDRATYYWSPSPVGPGFAPEVNSLDTRLQLAVGNRQAMAITEFSLRSLDPTIAPNTTGFGDMVVGAQALMLDGKRLKLSSIFRTYLSTGPARRGLGTGHTSLEPGLLARFCLSPRTYLFSEFKYWTPLGADPDYAGDVLTLGFAASTIFRESDVYAVLPTLELRTLTFLFGGQTSGLTTPVPPATDSNPILSRYDGRTAVELYPGARIVFGPAGDLGLWELNLAAGVTLAEDHWFDSRVRIGLRWNY